MARITLSCVPASWYCSVSLLSLGGAPRQRLLVLLLLLCSAVLLMLLWSPPRRPNAQLNKYLSMAESMEATDTENRALNYGVVVDCGSSGSRVFVYYWPPHNGNPHTLLDIQQMRDKERKPVVLKIKPGISTLSKTPTAASDYLQPLLGFAAAHVPKSKHKETPLYILCTAGMRLLPDSEQAAILEDIVSDVPLEFDFLFSESHAEVISGKQEGVYAWIGINFVLGRFDHADDEDATVEVTPSSQSRQPISRRRTVGIMDMGGASLQIAYEVPGVISFSSPQEEEAGKSVLAEFNLGCDVEHTQHVYRVYVTTFLGFGGNMARQRYEDQLFNSTVRSSSSGLGLSSPGLGPSSLGLSSPGLSSPGLSSPGLGLSSPGQSSPGLGLSSPGLSSPGLSSLGLSSPGLGPSSLGLSAEQPLLDPCLPVGLSDSVVRGNRTVHLRGQGDWSRCQEAVRPFLGLHNGTMSPGGVYQAPINFSNSEFYGFSEFYYCMEDVLRIRGTYDSRKYSRAASDYCATQWSVLKQRLDNKLFSQQADLNRLKYQCFKSAWMFEVLHSGFRFPADYSSLKTTQLVYDREVQWTLGAILFKTRFLPLRDLQQESLRPSQSASWLRSSFVYNHHVLSVCILVVALSILLYVLRLRRIHQREQRQNEVLNLLWAEEGEALLP